MFDSNEFEEVTIDAENLVPWPRIAAVAAMVGFSLPTFLTGLEVSIGLPPWEAFGALLLGSLIIFAIGGIIGMIGARTRMSSYLLIRLAFGDAGAGLVNIAFAISLLGWFGLNINLFTQAMGRLALSMFDIQLPEIAMAAIAGLCMTVTTLVGFRAINWLSTLMVPVLAFVTVWLITSALGEKSFAAIMQTDVEPTLTMGAGVSAIVGAIIVGAIILPDITRFAKTTQGAVGTAFIAYVPIQIVVMGAAGLAGSLAPNAEFLDILIDLGLGLGAIIIVIASSWALNSLNLYSTVLSVKATFPNWNRTALTIGLGAVGVIFALMNILDSFITFLIYLSAVFVPVAGVLVADYLVVRQDHYALENLGKGAAVNAKAFAAWLIGAGFAIGEILGWVPSPTGFAALEAALLTGAVYLAMVAIDRAQPSSSAAQEG
ncbi:MAG: cytosine permease [Erythrobacter sp.]